VQYKPASDRRVDGLTGAVEQDNSESSILQ